MPEMKYAIIIPDGCADEPQPSLGNRNSSPGRPLSHMNRIAQMGFVGRSTRAPAAHTGQADVATLSLFAMTH